VPSAPKHVVGFELAEVVIEGVWFTLTDTVAGAEVQPATVWVTEYVPPCVVLVIERVTGEPLATNEAGPVHAKLEPVAERVRVFPVQIGLGDAVTLVGAEGVEGSVKIIGPAIGAEGQPLRVTIILV
jgi:hypothetical protein